MVASFSVLMSILPDSCLAPVSYICYIFVVSKKQYIAIKKVREFISRQSKECQAQYLAMIEQLEKDGFLIKPFSKKIEKDLFELRVRQGRQVRIFYYYDTGDMVVGVHAFVKKTQKTPVREIKQARRVIARLKKGEYNE